MRVTAAALSLNVPDVEASADFVRRHLGFLTEMEADGFVSLSRPDTGFNLVFLRTGLASFKPERLRERTADGLLVVLVVEDVDGEHERLRAEGVPIATPIETEPWGERYFQVTDPNGVVFQLVEWVTLPGPAAGEPPGERPSEPSPTAATDDERPVLHGESVTLRPLQHRDVARVAAIQAEPAVARWWGQPDEAVLRRQAEGATAERVFAIETGGELVGLIQYWEENDPDYRHAGIDLFLAEHLHGSGLGTDAVRAMARYLTAERGHHRLTIDPAADNAPAIRAYEKAGFRAVGRMREYWRAADGTWRDGLLMDVLARDLEPA